MTDRVNALVVVLEADIRTDDVQPLVDAIQQLRGVLTVEQNVTDIPALAERTRAFLDIRARMYRALAREGEEVIRG